MDVDEALYYAELAAATGLERALAAEVRRLRARVNTMEVLLEVYVEMDQRARTLLSNPNEDEAWKRAAQHIIGEA